MAGAGVLTTGPSWASGSETSSPKGPPRTSSMEERQDREDKLLPTTTEPALVVVTAEER